VLVDGHDLADGHTIGADVCVIGAGPAGIALALRLEAEGVGVALLESGGLEADPRYEALLDGEMTGPPSPRTLRQSRGRGFGGTSNRWLADIGLRSRPLEPIDFTARPGLAGTGWPISYDQVLPYLHQAQQVCGLGPYRYDARQWPAATGSASALVNAQGLRPLLFQRGPRDQFRRYLEPLRRSALTRLVLHANVTRLEVADHSDRVAAVDATNFTGKRLRVEAGDFVLATGGVENARMLLVSDDRHPGGLGNRYGNVGRYFMEHPHVGLGWFRTFGRDLADHLDFFDYRDVDGVRVEGAVGLSEAVMAAEGLGNIGFWLRATSAKHALVEVVEPFTAIGRHPPAAALVRSLDVRARNLLDIPVQRFVLGHRVNRHRWVEAEAEQLPNPESRVVLVGDLDELGVRRVRLDWRLQRDDHESIRRSHRLLDQHLRAAGIGWFAPLYGEAVPPGEMAVGNHHMGTTRMAASPRSGVVDADCAVHGIPNLFVAGSSVFPTSGSANPTLTLVALALRLGDHLARRHRQRGRVEAR
jgi:choline dehydrogenase-like flavoprotein